MRNIKLSTICIGLVALVIISSCGSSKKSSENNKNSPMNNMVARMQIKEPIKGVCDNENVIVILPLSGNGQVKAIAPKSKEELTEDLNSKVSYLHEKPDYEDKGSMNLIVNCKGELVQCKISNKTQSPELDSQIVAVFSEMKTWTAGKIHNKSVDTVVMYSFTIKEGKIVLS